MRVKNIFSFFKPDTTKALQFFQLFRFGAIFLIGIFFSKTGLSLDQIGTYEILMLLGSLVSFFWLSGIINSLLSLYKETQTDEGPKSKIIFTAFILICIFSACGFICLRIFSKSILALIGYQKELNYFNLFSWFALLNVPTFLIEYILLLKNKSKGIILYALVSFTLQIIVTVIPAYLFKSIEGSIYGLLILAILKFLLLIMLLKKYAAFEIEGPAISLFIQSATPLILSTLLSGSAEYIDGTLVSHFFGTGKFAIYQYGARELPIALLLANAMSSAMIPYFAKEPLKDTLARIKKQSTQLMHVLFPASAVLLLISKKVYPVLFNPAFMESAGIFNIFLLLIVSRLVFPQTILIGLKHNKAILFTSLLELFLNIGFTLYFLSIFGIAGVAIGTVVAYFIEKIILVFYTSYSLKIHARTYIPVPLLSIYTILLLCIFFINLVYL
jgi:O-antigen/teichoic acid export membrane protein